MTTGNSFNNFSLIVEDNPIDSLIGKHVMEDTGLVPVCVENGFVALDEVDKYFFSVIIVDLQMPMMNGVELIKRLRRLERTKNTPIIVTSSKNEQKDILNSINAGANDYLVKPIDPMLFKAKIEMQLKKFKSDWYEYEFDHSEDIQTASVECKFKIISINEIGCTIESDIPFEVESKTKIFSELFESFTADPILSKILDCKKIVNKYKVSLLFLGLTEDKRQKLRVFCRKLFVNLKNNKEFNVQSNNKQNTQHLKE